MISSLHGINELIIRCLKFLSQKRGTRGRVCNGLTYKQMGCIVLGGKKKNKDMGSYPNYVGWGGGGITQESIMGRGLAARIGGGEGGWWNGLGSKKILDTPFKRYQLAVVVGQSTW